MLDGTGYSVDQAVIDEMHTKIKNNADMITSEYFTTKTYYADDFAIHTMSCTSVQELGIVPNDQSKT